MAESKKGKYVPIYLEWLDVTQDLTAEEKGNLIDAVFLYLVEGIGLDESPACDKAIPIADRIITDYISVNSFPNGKPNGEYHWNWKGGKTPVNQRERSSGRYTEWRKAVFERDGFTCQICGQVGGGLQAHHIKRWSTNVNERYQVSNGITLCKKCHKELHGSGCK